MGTIGVQSVVAWRGTGRAAGGAGRLAALEPRVLPAPEDGRQSAARYWWDRETGMLSARLARGAPAAGAASVHVVGDDGSWITLDVAGERLRAVEVAIWPPLRRAGALVPPAAAPGSRLVVAGAAAEVSGPVSAAADLVRGAFRFRIGGGPVAYVVRAGRDVLLEATAEGRLAGVWLLHVPPTPSARDHDDRPH